MLNYQKILHVVRRGGVSLAEFKLVYKELEDLEEHSYDFAKECEEYRDSLQHKIINQFSNIPASPMSAGNSRISSARYYVDKKRSELWKKASDYKAFAKRVESLREDAKDVDEAVAKSVNTSRKTFLKENAGLKGDGWSSFLANLIVDVPVLGDILNTVVDIFHGAIDLKDSIRKWYEIDGGKKWVDTGLAIAEGALAVVGVAVTVLGVIAGGWSVAAVAGLIAGVIGIFNSITNISQQVKANKQKDPAFVQYYGGINSLSDWLRKKTFKSKWMNKSSNWFATGLDVIEGVCSIIMLGDGLKDTYKRSGLNKLWSKKVGVNSKGKGIYKFDFGEFIHSVCSTEGRKDISKTLKHSWKGIVVGDEGGLSIFKKRNDRMVKNASLVNKDMFKLNYWNDIKNFSETKKSEVKILNRVLKQGKNLGSLAVKSIKIATGIGEMSFKDYNSFKDFRKDAFFITKNIYTTAGYGGGISNLTDIQDITKTTLDFHENLTGNTMKNQNEEAKQQAAGA